MGLNAGDFVKLFKNLLPRGTATRAEQGTTFDDFAYAVADELVRIDTRTNELQLELDPRTTFELLPDFERVLGLPDPCVTAEQTVDQRRNAVVVKITQLGGNNPDFYIAVAAQLGYAITVTEFAPARCGVSHCGDRLNGAAWAYAWRVNSDNNTIRVARVGSAVAGDLLRDWSNEQLECAIQSRQPSHGILQFSYGHDGIKYDLSSTVGGGKMTVRTPGQQAVSAALTTLATFTRSTVGTYLDADGVLKSAAIDTPRVEYDYAGALLGLLLEGTARQNFALQSVAFPAPWGGTGITTVTANAGTAPDGTNTAAVFVEDGSNGFHYMAQNVVVVNATDYVASVFVKQKDRACAQIKLGGANFANETTILTFATGVVTFANGGTGGAIRYPNGWWRIWVKATSNGVGGAVLCMLNNGVANYIGDGVSGGYFWGAQIEAGQVPTSYIATAAVAVTRGADRLFHTLGGEFGQTAGTYFIQYVMRQANSGANNQFLFDANTNGASSNQATLFHAVGGTVRTSLNSGGGFGGLAFTTVAPSNLVLIKSAGAYALNDVAVARDGVAGTPDLVAPLPVANLTRLDIGNSHDGSQACIGIWVQKFDYYPTRKSNADLLALTAA